jgi:hypothetical protein
VRVVGVRLAAASYQVRAARTDSDGSPGQLPKGTLVSPLRLPFRQGEGLSSKGEGMKNYGVVLALAVVSVVVWVASASAAGSTSCAPDYIAER